MYKEQWKEILAVWRDTLTGSLDLTQAVGIHLVAEEMEKGEIHRFVSIDEKTQGAGFVVARIIRQLVDQKLADQDPTRVRIKAISWANRQMARDEFTRVP